MAQWLDEANNFLGLNKTDMTATNYFTGLENGKGNILSGRGDKPGVLMSLACAFCWSLTVCCEVRDCVEALEAMLFGDFEIGPVTHFAGGKLETLSKPRYVFFIICQTYRCGFAIYLCVLGVNWIAGTTGIQDLILNAVALVMIMDVDELIFMTLMPRRLQVFVEES